MLDDHLAIRVRDPGEQVPDCRVSLSVNFLLSLGDRLRDRGVCLDQRKLAIPKRLAGHFDDGLSNVMARSVEMGAQSPRVATGSRL